MARYNGTNPKQINHTIFTGSTTRALLPANTAEEELDPRSPFPQTYSPGTRPHHRTQRSRTSLSPPPPHKSPPLTHQRNGDKRTRIYRSPVEKKESSDEISPPHQAGVIASHARNSPHPSTCCPSGRPLWSPSSSQGFQRPPHPLQSGGLCKGKNISLPTSPAPGRPARTPRFTLYTSRFTSDATARKKKKKKKLKLRDA